MLRKSWICTLAMTLSALALYACRPADARADEWGRYYHWPYSSFHQYQWTPYEHERIYDGNYRYPNHMRRYAQEDRWRNWSTVRKPYYRGYHFELDQF